MGLGCSLIKEKAMSMRESKKTGKLKLLQLQEVTEAVEEKMVDERSRINALRKDSSKARAISSFNLFQTPEDIADKMVSMATIGDVVLEPSVGLGRIYRAIRKVSSCQVIMVDNSPDCCREMYLATEKDRKVSIYQRDFLTLPLGDIATPSCVIMNPPFKNGVDIRHILMAMQHLSSGGMLVALCANGPRQNERLKPFASHWEILPEKSFKSEGTGVSVALLTMHKE